MSISIYQGLRVTDPATCHPIPSTGVFHAAAALRKACGQVFFDRLYELFHTVDAHVLELSPERSAQPGARIRALAVSVGTLHRQSERTLDALDLGYDITLLDGGSPDEPDQSDPALLALVTGEHASELYIPALTEAGLAQPYGWWNNTDGPDGVSDAQFALRKQHWQHALTSPAGATGGDTFDLSPAQAGLTISHPGRLQIILELSERYRSDHN